MSLPSSRLEVPGGRTLTRDEETAVMQRRGQTVRRAIERVMADPRYQRAGDAQRARVLERLIEGVRSRTSTVLRRQYQNVVP